MLPFFAFNGEDAYTLEPQHLGPRPRTDRLPLPLPRTLRCSWIPPRCRRQCKQEELCLPGKPSLPGTHTTSGAATKSKKNLPAVRQYTVVGPASFGTSFQRIGTKRSDKQARGECSPLVRINLRYRWFTHFLDCTAINVLIQIVKAYVLSNILSDIADGTCQPAPS